MSEGSRYELDNMSQETTEKQPIVAKSHIGYEYATLIIILSIVHVFKIISAVIFACGTSYISLVALFIIQTSSFGITFVCFIIYWITDRTFNNRKFVPYRFFVNEIVFLFGHLVTELVLMIYFAIDYYNNDTDYVHITHWLFITMFSLFVTSLAIEPIKFIHTYEPPVVSRRRTLRSNSTSKK